MEKDIRKSVSLSPDVWKQIADYRFDARLPTEAEAIRIIVKEGLAAIATKDGKKPTRTAGATKKGESGA